MRIVFKELETLLNYDLFLNFHVDCGPDFGPDLRRFLNSTTDEVRTSCSRRLSLSILTTIGMTDFGVFREAVLRREVTGAIAYTKQRDHSAHTLYNYLLGWYFFRRCRPFRDAIEVAMRKRGLRRAAPKPFNRPGTFFGSVWQYASLLHDVGYMFEGGIRSLDFGTAIEQASIGATVARGYFDRLLWQDYTELDLPSLRDAFLLAISFPARLPFASSPNSLEAIADELRSLGSLELLAAHVVTECGAHTVAPDPDALTSDAFKVWKHHYSRHGSDSMARRIDALRKAFAALVDSGMPKEGIRLLDHGVCSGLLQLLGSTLYYRLHAAARTVTTPSHAVSRFLDLKWSPAFWWSGIVWASAATALHNVQQMSSVKKLAPDWPGKLALADDPLAFLGVLVDTVEEWDRYSVFKTLGHEPVQGNEIELGHSGGKITLRFLAPDGAKRAEKVTQALEGALIDWGALLAVEA